MYDTTHASQYYLIKLPPRESIELLQLVYCTYASLGDNSPNCISLARLFLHYIPRPTSAAKATSLVKRISVWHHVGARTSQLDKGILKVVHVHTAHFGLARAPDNQRAPQMCEY